MSTQSASETCPLLRIHGQSGRQGPLVGHIEIAAGNLPPQPLPERALRHVPIGHFVRAQTRQTAKLRKHTE